MNPAIDVHGDRRWWVDGNLHRLDGPAIEKANGTRVWCVNGKLHRLDGPAIERVDGHNEWWVNDKGYSKEEFNKLFGKYKDLEDRQVVADMEGMF